jgi:hypothetical protein
MLGDNAPQDWGIADKTEWIAEKPFEGEAKMPALEGCDVIGYSEVAEFSVKLAPGKPPGAKQWKDIRNRPVELDSSSNTWKLSRQQPQQKTPAQRMAAAVNRGNVPKEHLDAPKPKQKAPQKPQEPHQEKREERVPENKTYNTSIPSRTPRGARNIVINENDLKNNFPNPADQEKVLKITEALNSQMENGVFKETEGKGGKKDRTLLWEEAQALAHRDNKEWSNLIESGPPYPQERVTDFMDSAFIRDVPREMAEYVYSYLPAPAKNQLNKNGTPQKGKIFTGEGASAEEQSSGNSFTSPRGVSILHAFLKQGGRDAYTGLPLNLGDSEAEHINVQQSGGLDHPDNLVMIRGGVNQKRGSSPLEALIKAAKGDYGDGGDEAKNKLEQLRQSRAEGSKGRAGAKEQINSIPMEELLGKSWDEIRQLDELTEGSNKGTQYALRRIDFYNLGDRLRGGKVVMPSTVAFPLAKAFFNGDSSKKEQTKQSFDTIRSNFKTWLNEGSGSPEAYIKSIKLALDQAGTDPKDMRRAFLDKFFIDVAKTHNDWLVRTHGYESTTPQKLKQYYESL